MALETTVTTDRTQYSPSKSVEILVRMTNTGPASIAYRVNRFEYEIRIRESRTRRLVWTWSKGKTPPTPFSVQLLAGQWRQHLELWDGRDDSGKRVPAGIYEIEATHVPDNRTDTIQIALNDRGGDGSGNGGGGGTVNEPLQGALKSDKQVVKPGESLHLTYLVSNRGKEPITIPFTSGRQFEIEASQSTGTRLWAHTQDQAYLQMLTRLTLAPGETRTLTSVWRVGLVADGVVTLTAYLTSSQGPLIKVTSQITIKK